MIAKIPVIMYNICRGGYYERFTAEEDADP